MRYELSAAFKAESVTAAPARTRRTHTPLHRSCGKVAALLCSLVALMGGGSGEELCELTPDSVYEHISGSDDDVYEPDVTKSRTNSPDPNDVNDTPPHRDDIPRMPCTPVRTKHRD